MNNEMLAVNYLNIALSKTDYLVPHINAGDREPSWDGDIEVYRKAGNVHAKEDLVLKVPVQVKGKISKISKKKSITYPVEITDMCNYLNMGGTVFFVVLVDESGEKYRIYYSCMLPFELKTVLKKSGNKKTQNMPMTALPDEKKAIANIFLNCANDMKRQKAAITADDVSYEKLMQSGSIKELSMSVSVVPSSEEMPFDYLFDNGAYLYAKLPYGFELPIEHMPKMEVAVTEKSARITVNGKPYYEKYRIIYKRSCKQIQFGESSNFALHTNTQKHEFSFTLSGTLSERIRDEEFIIDALTAGQFEVNGIICPLNGATPKELERFNVPIHRKHLDWMKRIKTVLDRLNVQDELDCTNITEDDDRKLRVLYAAICDEQPVALDDVSGLIGQFVISNLTILLCIQAIDGDSKKYRLYDFNNCPVKIGVPNDDGDIVPSSIYTILAKENILKCCNINYQKMLAQLKTTPSSEKQSAYVVLLLLEMLLAYDESEDKRKDILNAALEMASWIKKEDVYTEEAIRTLNYYQAIKRTRSLTDAERCTLLKITESTSASEPIYTGAYLLLDEQSAARSHFERMDLETQETFKHYPIFRFWKETAE